MDKTNEPATPFLSKSEAAQRARVSGATLDRAIRDGRLRANRFGRRVLIEVNDLDSLVRGGGEPKRETR